MRRWTRVVVAALGTVVMGGLAAGPAMAATTNPVVMHGTVTSTSGAPLAGITIACRSPLGETDATTDAKGTYAFHQSDFDYPQLENCTKVVFVDPASWYAFRYYPGTYDATKVQAVVPSAANPVVNGVLERGGTVKGRAVDAKGRGLAVVNVALYWGPDTVADSYYWGLTGPDGTFTLTGMPPGLYRLGFSSYTLSGYTPVFHNGYSLWTWADFDWLHSGQVYQVSPTVLPSTTGALFTSAPAPVVGTNDGLPVAVGSTLTAVAPTSVPADNRPQFFWYSDGVEVSDLGWSYTVQPSDAGKTLVAVVVRKSNGYGSSTAASVGIKVPAAS